MNLERFKKLGPPTFQGTVDPMVVEAWLKQRENIFVAMGCNDNQRVILALFVPRCTYYLGVISGGIS